MQAARYFLLSRPSPPLSIFLRWFFADAGSARSICLIATQRERSRERCRPCKAQSFFWQEQFGVDTPPGHRGRLRKREIAGLFPFHKFAPKLKCSPFRSAQIARRRFRAGRPAVPEI